jgi:hypothetical protein
MPRTSRQGLGAPRTGVLLVLICAVAALALPVTASAVTTAALPTVATITPGCQAKGIWGIPVPKASGTGLAANTYYYTVTALVNAGATETTPCGAQAVTTDVSSDSALLQWNAVPGAVGYKIYRSISSTPGAGEALIFAAGPVEVVPPSAVCPPSGAGPRCFFQDNGGASDPTANDPAPVGPKTDAGGSADLKIVQGIDYGGNAVNPADDPTYAPGDPTTNQFALKTDVFHFPVGLLADPAAAPKCKLFDAAGPSLMGDSTKFGRDDPTEDSCPANTHLGTVQAVSRTQSGSFRLVQGDVYNGETKGTEPARLFISLRPVCSLHSPVAPGSATCNAALGSSFAEVEGSFLAAVANFVQRPDGTLGVDVSTVEAEDDAPLSAYANIVAGAPGSKTRAAQATSQIKSLTQQLVGAADQGTETTSDDKSFVRLPTSCSTSQTLSADKTTWVPESASASNTFTTDNCLALPYSPNISGTIGGTGNTNAGAHPNLDAAVTQPAGEAGTRTIKITLPSTVASSASSVPALCSEAQAASDTCPAASQVGTASATSPLLPVPSTGKVFLVTTPTGPKVVTLLKGAVNLRLDGTIALTPSGRILNVVDNVPDVPISTFALHLTGGKTGLLVNLKNLCTSSPSTLDVEFDGYNGKVVNRTSTLTRVGTCPPIPTKPTGSGKLAGVKKGKPVGTMTLKRGAANAVSSLKNGTIALSKGFKINTKKAKKGLVVKADGKKLAKSALKITSKSIKIKSIKAGTAATITIKFGKKVLTVSKAIKKKGKKAKPNFKTKLTVTDGTAFTIPVKIKVKS